MGLYHGTRSIGDGYGSRAWARGCIRRDAVANRTGRAGAGCAGDNGDPAIVAHCAPLALQTGEDLQEAIARSRGGHGHIGQRLYEVVADRTTRGPCLGDGRGASGTAAALSPGDGDGRGADCGGAAAWSEAGLQRVRASPFGARVGEGHLSI